MANHSEKESAVNKAASKGVGSLSRNERHAYEEARKDGTEIGRQARNIADGKNAGHSDRNFLGF